MYKKESFPRNLNEFVGNNNIKIILDILIKNNIEDNRVIPHILFYSRPGLGKTTLAEIVASETNSYFYSLIGNQVSEEVIENILISIIGKDILFIDEIHSLDSKMEEILYSVLQDSILRTTQFELKLPKFTIIGATTEKYGLNKPLIDRFIYQLNLQNYSLEEMYQICQLYSKEFGEKSNISLNKDSIEVISNISQGVPRLLKNFYLICLDFAIRRKVKEINLEIVYKVMSLLHINKIGLDLLQQRYMNYLKEMNRPVGLNAIASFLGVNEKDINLMVEPFLLEKGFMAREPRGRIITERGKEII